MVFLVRHVNYSTTPIEKHAKESLNEYSQVLAASVSGEWVHLGGSIPP